MFVLCSFLSALIIYDDLSKQAVAYRQMSLTWTELVSVPSGRVTTITLRDGAPDRLVNLYRGRGGPPV